MNNTRIWLFRVLVLVAAGLILLTWLMPWWSCDLLAVPLYDAVTIHPWGLSNILGEYSYFVKDAEMPGWFAPLMWCFLGACMFCLFLGMFVKDTPVSLGKLNVWVPRWLKSLPLPSWLIGGVGVAYIVCAIVAVIFAAMRMGDFFGGIPLQGYTYIQESGSLQWPTGLNSRLLPGYYLTYVAGLACIVLGLLRNRIIAKP